MKTKLFYICLILLLLGKKGYSQWYQEKFVIGTFSDPKVSRDNDAVKDSISFARAKAIDINLLTGPQFFDGGPGFNLMDRTLDLASKFGMHVMVIDSKLLINKDEFSSDDAQNIMAHFKSLDPKRRAALGGYSVGGEYPMAKAAKLRKWIGYINNNDNDRPAYTYLQPVYGYHTREQYEKYVDSWLSQDDANTKVKIVAYDYYPFLSPDILKSYFYNLGLIKEKAGDRPVWYFVQAYNVKTQPDVTDYQIRFSAYCPLAYGSKGAIYFTYETVPGPFSEKNYDGLLNRYSNVTWKYYTAKIIDDYISYIAGPIIMDNKCVGTYHVSKAPTNEDIPNTEMLGRGNAYVKSISDKNILVGVFKNERASKYYLMLINKSNEDSSGINISVPGKRTIIAYPGSFKYHGSKTMTPISGDQSNGNTNFTIDKIPGGELTVVEID